MKYQGKPPKRTENSWIDWMSNFTEANIQLNMPKFKLRYGDRLNQALIDLGMGVAFSPSQADFSKINPDDQLYISFVKHKTFIDVNESHGFIGLLSSFISLIIISLMSIHFLKVISKLPSTSENIWCKFPSKSGLASFIALVFYAIFQFHICLTCIYWLSVKNTNKFSSFWCLSLWNEFLWYAIGKAAMYLFWIFR